MIDRRKSQDLIAGSRQRPCTVTSASLTNATSNKRQEDIYRLPRNVILSDTFVSLVRHYREYAANCLAKRSAMGMGNVGFGAGSASSEPVLALFPRLAADPALMMVRNALPVGPDRVRTHHAE